MRIRDSNVLDPSAASLSTDAVAKELPDIAIPIQDLLLRIADDHEFFVTSRDAGVILVIQDSFLEVAVDPLGAASQL